MKAIKFAGPEKIRIADIPIPEAGDGEVLAKIVYAGICGTDLDLLTGDMVHIKNGFTVYPLVPGHEWAGTVEAVGSRVTGFRPGDKVTSDVSLGCGSCDYCRMGRYNLCPNREVVGSYRNRQGAFAEYIAIPVRHLYRIPDSVSLEEAALTEPAGTAAYAVQKAGELMGLTVLVIGDGPIGQLAAQLAKQNGAARVMMAGSWDEKLAVAEHNGTDAIMNYHRDDIVTCSKDASGGLGPDVIIESSGNPETLNQAVTVLRPGGKIVCVSWYGDMDVSLRMDRAIAKDCSIIGALASPNTFDAVLAYMASGTLNVKPLVTHVKPLEQFEEVVRMIREKREYRLKVLLTP
jgi:2-desacetyl-2-hydroxyethyl bacteriochlorophyllide A dehydrogenase